MGALTLAACGGPEIPDSGAEAIQDGDVDRGIVVSADEEPDLLEECDAINFRNLIGTSIADALVNEGPDLRVYAENELITQEFLPQRTNIVTDVDGTVTRVYCG
ncbi:MAG: I78 family peptidase inhibitor [Pseudomonadota bacterium]